jgi:hypothetical protein
MDAQGARERKRIDQQTLFAKLYTNMTKYIADLAFSKKNKVPKPA